MDPAAVRREQHRVARGMGAAALLAAVTLAAAWWLAPSMPAADPLHVALVGGLFIALTLAVMIARVAAARFTSPDDIAARAGGADSAPIVQARAVLQNTLEQAVLAVVTQTGLAVQLAPERWLVLPALTALFVIGRIAFATGYARGAAARAFGFGLTFYPSVAACIAGIGLALT